VDADEPVWLLVTTGLPLFVREPEILTDPVVVKDPDVIRDPVILSEPVKKGMLYKF
jgi:hypothetical protein